MSTGCQFMKTLFYFSFETLYTEIYLEEKEKNGAHFFSFTEAQIVTVSDSQQLVRTELKYPKET